MKKLGKLLPSVSLILLITTAILVVLTSHAFAKYFKTFELESFNARPATFEFAATGSKDTTIFVDFGMDAETAPIFGTRRLTRTYDFSVKTAGSEVESLLAIELFLPEKLYTKIIQADKTTPGVWVSWKMYVVTDYGLPTESLEDITELGVVVESAGNGTWTYNEVIQPSCNPHGKVDHTDFRIEFEILNVEDNSNIKDAFLYISNLNLKVSSTQID